MENEDDGEGWAELTFVLSDGRRLAVAAKGTFWTERQYDVNDTLAVVVPRRYLTDVEVSELEDQGVLTYKDNDVCWKLKFEAREKLD